MASETWWESWTGETEGRVQALYSVRVTAGGGGGEGGEGGGMLAMLMVFLLLFKSFLHFLVRLLVNHYSWSYYTRNQWIHRTHARARWWVWRGVGIWGLASWISWLWYRMTGSARGKAWIPLVCSWGSGKGVLRKGRVGR